MNNWIKEISKDAFEFNKDHVKISVHILLEKEDDFYTAHCLEFDITADGKTLKEAQQNIINCIRNHIEFCIEIGNYNQIYDPAPQEYWNKLLCSRPIDSFPFPDNESSSNLVFPIRQVESYEVECRA